MELTKLFKEFFDSGKAGGVVLIGLELEREIYQGELSNIKNALLPIFGAFGGMLLEGIGYRTGFLKI